MKTTRGGCHTFMHLNSQGSPVTSHTDPGHRLQPCQTSSLCPNQMMFLTDQTLTYTLHTCIQGIQTKLFLICLLGALSENLWSTQQRFIGEDFPSSLDYLKVLTLQASSPAGVLLPTVWGSMATKCQRSVSEDLTGASKTLQGNHQR